ncbi:uncharacterized protein LOC107781552 [Nicotiana tabacum]|uniref:Uncharacterized protein n=1 Tax=Nicotiana tabacum TaxID=4097 RepID=A0A1S3YZY8_TOBAC|nr:PREDICTED: uncharacterized protein LOC107781552 [Nicotiana tabacum]XP_016457759.1 PREDICTED: uncharacterized protein LOC107781552 [Nicotiana tabacum]XP_016457760.1 PREDICTED: uncharacterized protein LOC107781552 [Nicotiana tabacum]
MPKRDIFAHFYGNNRAISSLPYDFGFHDCKWVDTGQVRASYDAKIDEITLKDTMDSAAIDCTSDNRSDLIVENSLLLDNSKAPSEVLQNPMADSLPGYSAILGHQLFDTMSNRHCYSKSCEVVCAALSIDYSDRYGDFSFQLKKLTIYYSDIRGVAEVQDELKEIVHYLHDPKRCTRLNDDGLSHNITKMFDNSFQSDLPLIGCPTSESKLIGWFYLVKRLAAGEWVTVGVPACGLFHIAYSNASDMLTVDLLSTYSQMRQEDMPMVRRLVATHLGKFVANVAPTYLKIDITSMFDYLTHGTKILVRVVALDILYTRLLLAFGVKPYSGIYEKTSGSLKDQLEAITPALEKVSNALGSIKNYDFLEYLKKFLDWSVQSEAVSNTGSLIGCSVNDLVLALSTYHIQVGNGKRQKRGEPSVEISEEDCVDKVNVIFENGQQYTGALLVGVDGVWSEVSEMHARICYKDGSPFQTDLHREPGTCITDNRGLNDTEFTDTGERLEYSKLSLALFVSIMIDIHMHVKSSWLDNERGVFDDIIGRNSLAALRKNSTQVLAVKFDLFKNWQLLAKSQISHSIRPECHIEIFSFVEKVHLEPRATWIHTKVLSVVGLRQDEVDAVVSIMKVEKPPSVLYADFGGSDAQNKEIKEVFECPLPHPQAF